MKLGKVVFLTCLEPQFRDIFIAESPADLHVVMLDPSTPEEDIIEQVRDADFLVLYRSGIITDKVIRSASRLKLIQTMGQGTDNIPKRLASEMGIHVANVGGANAQSVAEHTILLILASLKRLLPSIEVLRQGKFRESLDTRYFHQLCEKTVGIVGFGNTGQRVAQIVNSFGAHVIFSEVRDIRQSTITDLRARQVSLEELLSSADVVTLHVPLQQSTRLMIGRKQLSMMRPSAILINTSRGSIVDEKALIRALREKKIAGAGIDVFDQEPPSTDNPLLNMDNVVATPHIAGQDVENWIPRVKNAWGNLLLVWQGKEPQNVVCEF